MDADRVGRVARCVRSQRRDARRQRRDARCTSVDARFSRRSARTGLRDGSAVTFRVASTRATRIELELFDQPTGAARDPQHRARPDAGGVFVDARRRRGSAGDDLLRLSRVGAELAVRSGVAARRRRGLDRGCRWRRQSDESEQARVRSVRARAVARSDDARASRWHAVRDRHRTAISTRRAIAPKGIVLHDDAARLRRASRARAARRRDLRGPASAASQGEPAAHVRGHVRRRGDARGLSRTTSASPRSS